VKYNKNLNKSRREYKLNKLFKKNVRNNPFEQFSIWFSEALKGGVIEPNAMVLATSDGKNKPSSRMVLMKDFNETGFTFYTNYESNKGKALAENPVASLLFFWAEFERQVRIEGRVKKLTRTESEDYFHTRPFESRISVLASDQSKKITDRRVLEKNYRELKQKHADGKIPMPDYWGGYKLIPNYFEFWQGREYRLHDRISYKLQGGNWRLFRLAP
jgi:pyridoxamine 5'-phosphate oxidase